MEDKIDNRTMQPEQETTDAQNIGCQKEVSDLTEKLTRLSADFENFKRRTDKDRLHWISSGQQAILKDTITLLDDFERALSQAPDKNQHPELTVWFSGFDLIHKSFLKLLSKYGVTQMAEYVQFDPEKHEALMSVASDKAPGLIVQVLEKGYMYNDQVLRPAKVSVAQ